MMSCDQLLMLSNVPIPFYEPQPVIVVMLACLPARVQSNEAVRPRDFGGLRTKTKRERQILAIPLVRELSPRGGASFAGWREESWEMRTEQRVEPRNASLASASSALPSASSPFPASTSSHPIRYPRQLESATRQTYSQASPYLPQRSRIGH